MFVGFANAWSSTFWSNRNAVDPTKASELRGRGSNMYYDKGILHLSGIQPRLWVNESQVYDNMVIDIEYMRVEDSNVDYAGLVVGVKSGPGHVQDDDQQCKAHTIYSRITNDGKAEIVYESKHEDVKHYSDVDIDFYPKKGELPYNDWIKAKIIVRTGEFLYVDLLLVDKWSDPRRKQWKLVGSAKFGTENVPESEKGEAKCGPRNLAKTDGFVIVRNTEVKEARYRNFKISRY